MLQKPLFTSSLASTVPFGTELQVGVCKIIRKNMYKLIIKVVVVVAEWYEEKV